jgi:drug/metabolite transporter (DMT)-like permease
MTSKETTISLIVYCISGTLLTLVNKLAILAFPAPNTLLLFQNGATVLLLLALTHIAPDRVGGPLPSLTLSAFKSWLPLTLLFVGMLGSSLLALQNVSSVTLIVFRNLCTLVVAFFERLVLGSEINTLAIFSLVGILCGAILYALNDIQFSIIGYAWLIVNVSCTAAFQIYVKSLISHLPKDGPGSLGPFGMSYFNNVISLPVFGILAAIMGEVSHLRELIYALSVKSWIIIVSSALLGFTLSTSAFLVTKLVTATSMMVANNVNKFALIILSELFVEQTLVPLSSLGTALVMVFAWIYSQSKGVWANIFNEICAKNFREITVFTIITSILFFMFGFSQDSIFLDNISWKNPFSLSPSQPKLAAMILVNPHEPISQTIESVLSFRKMYSFPHDFFVLYEVLTDEMKLVLSTELSFVKLINVSSYFQTTHVNAKPNTCTFYVGYHLMCRFMSGPVYWLPEFDIYEQLLRIDDDSRFTKRLSRSLELVGQESYGFTLYHYDQKDCSQGFMDFMRLTYGTSNDVKRFGLGAYYEPWVRINDTKVFNCNFEVVSLKRFRSRHYKEYWSFIDASGLFFSTRLGDHQVKTVYLETFEPAENIVCYAHLPYFHQGTLYDEDCNFPSFGWSTRTFERKLA